MCGGRRSLTSSVGNGDAEPASMPDARFNQLERRIEMIKWINSILIMTAFVVPLAKSQIAQATITITSPYYSAYITVAKIPPWGHYVVIGDKQSSACTFQQVGGIEGYSDNLVIYGGDGDDSIRESTGDQNLCGYWMQTANSNGYRAKLYGQGGADYVAGGTNSSAYLYGGNGNDELQVGSGYAPVAWGNAGNDTLRGSFSTSTEFLLGDGGSDLFCEKQYSNDTSGVYWMDGGTGTDYRYGTAYTVKNIEKTVSQCSR